MTDWLGQLLMTVLWLVGVPVLVFGGLKLIGYDFDKPWLMWRTRAVPLPLWVYLIVSGCIALAILVAAANR